MSVGLSVALFPHAGLLVSTIMLGMETAAFVIQRRTEPEVRLCEQGDHRAVIFLRPVQLITLALIPVATVFVTAEVSTVAPGCR